MIDPDHPGSSSQIKKKELEQFLRSAARTVGLAGEVNVRITSDQEMRRLNRQFRGKNKSTDVLSFPASSNGKSSLAGDIAISLQIATANAQALGHTLESEIKILLLHGLLHLAGHDHEADRGEMAALEQKLRAKLKLPLGLIARASSSKVVRANVEPAAPGRVFRGVRKRTSGEKTLRKSTSSAAPSQDQLRNRSSLPAQRQRIAKKRSPSAVGAPDFRSGGAGLPGQRKTNVYLKMGFTGCGKILWRFDWFEGIVAPESQPEGPHSPSPRCVSRGVRRRTECEPEGRYSFFAHLIDDPYQTGMPPFGLKFPESANPMPHANGLRECRASRSPSILPSTFVSKTFLCRLFSLGQPSRPALKRVIYRRSSSQGLKALPPRVKVGASHRRGTRISRNHS
jgi:probable rRNA maturation factor